MPGRTGSRRLQERMDECTGLRLLLYPHFFFLFLYSFLFPASAIPFCFLCVVVSDLVSDLVV